MFTIYTNIINNTSDKKRFKTTIKVFIIAALFLLALFSLSVIIVALFLLALHF
jgi:hypothetical protein